MREAARLFDEVEEPEFEEELYASLDADMVRIKELCRNEPVRKIR